MTDIAKDHDTARHDTARHDTARSAVVGQTALAGRLLGLGPDPAPVSPAPSDGRTATALRYLLAATRLSLGWVFMWAFLDKLFGFGHNTLRAKSWINGGNPTKGFLGAASGPFGSFYHNLAGNTFVSWLFMLALVAIGGALILGIGMRLAAAGGAVLTVMMWSAVLPPSSNPFMDDHLVYALVLIVLAILGAGRTLGFGRAWAATPLVRRLPWLT